ncbi:hypothetical protein ACJ72_06034 [Emergomyces africanus]|uniref:Uncharacterized protein n=1 Tax=Emergomyces africanus TaxID=1955775 RepID=A0A1B7NSD5_9EURO|nr:hypothetical protein ACJ72_06034 [Emergomyces africanus]
MSYPLQVEGDSKRGHDQGSYRIDSSLLANQSPASFPQLVWGGSLGKTPLYPPGTSGNNLPSQHSCPLL